MHRHPDAQHTDAGPSTHLDHHGGEQDREAATASQDELEEGVLRVVVAPPVTGEPDLVEQMVTKPLERPLRTSVREHVEGFEGAGLVHAAAQDVLDGQRGAIEWHERRITVDQALEALQRIRRIHWCERTVGYLPRTCTPVPTSPRSPTSLR